MKGDRWTPANKRAAAGFSRYIRRFPSYTSAQRQTAEAAFLSGFRSGVVFVEQQYRDIIRGGRPAQETRACPADLVGALQDRVHEDAGPVRAGRSVKETRAGDRCEQCGVAEGEIHYASCPYGQR